MFVRKFRQGERHKFVGQLKKYLNELVQPSPKLPDDDVFDKATQKAINDFKRQWIPKLGKTFNALNSKPEADLFT